MSLLSASSTELKFPMTGTARLSVKAFALMTALVCINSFVSATTPITAFPYDDLFLLDGIWRVVQGQHAGIDYYNPIGFGIFHIGAALWKLFGGHRWILPLTSALLSELIALSAAVIASRRLSFSPAYCLLICAVFALQATGPSVYGWSIASIGMGAVYNRLSVAGIAILFLYCFARPIENQRGTNTLELLLILGLLNLLFLVKISAFGLAIGLIIVARVMRRETISNRAAFLLILGLGLLIAGDFWLAGMTPAAVLHDYREAAEVRRTLAGLDGILVILGSWGAMLTVPLLALYAFSKPRIGLSNWHVVAIIIVYLGAQIFLNVSNTQPATVSLAPACAAVLLASKRPIGWPRNLWRLSESLPLAIFLVVALAEILPTAIGFTLWSATDLGLVRPVVMTGETGLSLPVVHFAGIDREHTTGFAQRVDNGIRLLKSFSPAETSVASLDYANPFPVLLGWPSPKNTPIVLALGFMEPLSRIDPTHLVGDACVVMAPRHPTIVVQGSSEIVAASAAPLLASQFTLAAENEDWQLYHRNHGCETGELGSP